MKQCTGLANLKLIVNQLCRPYTSFTGINRSKIYKMRHYDNIRNTEQIQSKLEHFIYFFTIFDELVN